MKLKNLLVGLALLGVVGGVFADTLEVKIPASAVQGNFGSSSSNSATLYWVDSESFPGVALRGNGVSLKDGNYLFIFDGNENRLRKFFEATEFAVKLKTPAEKDRTGKIKLNTTQNGVYEGTREGTRDKARSHKVEKMDLETAPASSEIRTIEGELLLDRPR